MRVNMAECEQAYKEINVTRIYTQEQGHMVGHCMLKYDTNARGEYPISGQLFKDTVDKIFAKCHNVSLRRTNAFCDVNTHHNIKR